MPSFCPDCGAELAGRRIEGRQRRYCTDCERPVYRNPKPAAGVLVVRDDTVFLVERTIPPTVGHWSVPAGYLEVDEPPREAAARELHEETGLDVDPAVLELFETVFSETDDRDPVLVVVYVVAATATTGTPQAGSDAAARFWSRESLDDVQIEPGYRVVLERAIDRPS